MASQLETQIATAFRADELQRRRARAQILVNHAALLEGEASEADKPGVKEAAESLRKWQQAEARHAVQSLWWGCGYWHRLWCAVTDKLPDNFKEYTP